MVDFCEVEHVMVVYVKIVDDIHRFMETDHLETRSKWVLGLTMIVLTMAFVGFAVYAFVTFPEGGFTKGISLLAFGVSCLAFAVTIGSHADSTRAAGESRRHVETALQDITTELAGIRADLDTSSNARAVWSMADDINRLEKKMNWCMAISLLPRLRRK